MSAQEDLPDPTQVVSIALRREALLPNERGRGLGTVAVVCTMAGVASGLALATTLMAMQVADSMSSRQQCPYQIEMVPAEVQHNAYLGAVYQYDLDANVVHVTQIKPNTPAQAVGLRADDRIVAVDGVRITHDDFQQHIGNSAVGQVVTLTVARGGDIMTFRPILAAWPY